MEALKASNLFGVEGIVAVITGGGSGLGLIIAKALDLNGAKAVYIVGRREESLQKAAAQGANGKIIPIVGDVTSKESLAAAAARVEREQGFVNVVIANSGVSGPGAKLPSDRPATVKEIKEANWALSMDDFTSPMHVNCTGAFYTAMAFLELLDAGNKQAGNKDAAPRSQIIITSSIAGYSRKVAAGHAYSISKAGAIHLAKLLSTTLLHTQIRVNAIAPGLYPSEMTQSNPLISGNDKNPGQYGSIPFETVPLTRIGTDEDIAGAALYLVSRAGAYCNGLSIVTDGGRLGNIPNTY